MADVERQHFCTECGRAAVLVIRQYTGDPPVSLCGVCIGDLGEMKEQVEEDLRRHQCDRADSWWEYDAQGIPLDRVCDKCRSAKLSKYRPEILEGYSQADVDEPIEPEDY